MKNSKTVKCKGRYPVIPQLQTVYPYITSVTQGFSPDSSTLPAAPAILRREGLSYR